MKLLLFTTILFSSLSFSSPCGPEVKSRLFNVDIKITRVPMRSMEKLKGTLEADTINCSSNHFDFINFNLDGDKDQFLTDKLLQGWITFLDKDILRKKGLIDIVLSVITSSPILKGRLESIKNEGSNYKYLYDLSVKKGLSKISFSKKRTNFQVLSQYNKKQNTFKNFILTNSKKIAFKKLELELTAVPLKIKNIKAILTNGKTLKIK